MANFEDVKPRYVVVDFQNTLWKSWMVKPSEGEDLVRADGYPTGHVFRFFRTIQKWKRNFSGHLVFCYEGGEKLRYDLYPGYKAGRKDRTLDFNPAPDVMRLLSLIKCTELKPKDAEADDAIAAFVSRHPEANHLILSSDKDLWTCRAPNVEIVSFQDLLSEKDIEKSCVKHYGVCPKSITLAKSLFGDKSDGLPGVPRLLKKHVADLLLTASSPDDLYASLSKLPTTTQEKLRVHEAQIRKMHEVVQLRRDVKLKKREREGDEKALRAFLREFECASLIPQATYMCS